MRKNFKSVNIWQSYKQERDCLMHFARLANTLLKDEESARDNYVLACNFVKYLPIYTKILTLGNKHLLIWLLTTLPHLKHVATLPCNLSLVDINVSQGSVTTYARCECVIGFLIATFMHIYQRIFQRNICEKRLRFDRIMVTSLGYRFWRTCGS